MKTFKKVAKALLFSSIIVLAAAGCSRGTTTQNSGPAPTQVVQYTGKLDKVKQIVNENGQQITGTFTVADGQDALTMLRSFRTIQVNSSSQVTSIDGLASSSGHWTLYVNGKTNTGSYKIKDGDVLEWKQ